MSFRRSLRRRGLQLVKPGQQVGPLDPRPARSLTSREVAKVLGAVLGATSVAIGVDQTKVVLEKLSVAVKIEDVADQRGVIEELQALLLPPGIVLTMSATLSALYGGLATEEATDVAVRWWLETGCAGLGTGSAPWLIPDADGAP
jgi:hypothetical protein